eukprot:c54132_g1_i1.p1 GENE.c54132_g1_i1~~c54132_g1_i1.p1  ORF type:complete len:248 (+),score=26.77 c54132_g1_i1:118-861(+)
MDLSARMDVDAGVLSHTPRAVSAKAFAPSPDVISGLFSACRTGKANPIRTAIRKISPMAPSELRDVVDSTPLHVACSGSQTRVVEMLVREYAHPVNCLDRYGRSPLVLASYRADGETVAFLLGVKADPNSSGIIDECGRWAFGRALPSVPRTIGRLAEGLIRDRRSLTRLFKALPVAVRSLVRTLLIVAHYPWIGTGPERRGTLNLLALLDAPMLHYLLDTVAAMRLRALMAAAEESSGLSDGDEPT